MAWQMLQANASVMAWRRFVASAGDVVIYLRKGTEVEGNWSRVGGCGRRLDTEVAA